MIYKKEYVEKMIRFVGISCTVLPKTPRDSLKINVKLRYDGGCLCSFGSGDTKEEAIQSAMHGFPISWSSVREKMLDTTIVDIMHL